MAPTTVRLGTASPATQATTAETLAQLEQFARRAAAKKIDILLLPEAYLGGYPRGEQFASVIRPHSQEGREEYLRYFQNAIDLGDTVGDGAGAGQAWVNRELPADAVPGSDGTRQVHNKRGDGTREELERVAQETGVFIITGLTEKAGGSLYCSVVYVCPQLGIIGKRRKVMPTGTERLVWAQGSPATLRAVSTIIRGIRINLAAAICWENYMPLVRQALYAQNINLYLAPNADDREAWLSLARTAAVEGRCFVISSNMCARTSPPTAATSSTDGHHTPAFHQDDIDDNNNNTLTDGAEPHHTPASDSHAHRRNSCVTEEGFEIALPRSPYSHTATRRQSVIDEDGNEIVLPKSPLHPMTTTRRQSVFDEERNEIVLPKSPIHPSTTRHQSVFDDEGFEIALPKPPLHHPPPRPPPKRRQSVFDDDGNEIVLCANTSTKSPQNPTPTTSNTTTKTEYLSRGGSAIVSPFGYVLAGPQWEDDSGIIYADVDFQDCIRGRLDLDTAGHYSRNDSFKFSVAGLELVPLPY